MSVLVKYVWIANIANFRDIFVYSLIAVHSIWLKISGVINIFLIMPGGV